MPAKEAEGNSDVSSYIIEFYKNGGRIGLTPDEIDKLDKLPKEPIAPKIRTNG